MNRHEAVRTVADSLCGNSAGRRLLAALLLILAVSSATPREVAIRVFRINDHLLSFYDGRPAEASHHPVADTWVDSSALNVGVATYAIHRGDAALVYDSYP